ncbi:MAG: two-component system, NarL family, nitrate/nitrite response regulator NarL [Solirubrobacteraceae bacterium]|nr:two-component system, NarL family, nitrate/nitrite response regulator NarL [Solirubrobacteraceae bacterium]
MKRMFIVGTDGFLVTTMRVALRYSSEITVFGVRDADASVRRALREARPDIVLLDGSASAERTRERLADVAEERPDAIVLVLASSVDPDALEDLLEAGATVCLSRALTSGQLETLLADAAQHQASAPAAVRAADPAPQAEGQRPESCPLTNRELEILRCVAEGHTNARIGRDLWVTEQTVKFHLSNIYRKLGVSNRTEASRYVLLNNLGVTRPAPQPVPAAAPSMTPAPRQVNGTHNGNGGHSAVLNSITR